jgi:hypothetical protein
LCAPFEFCDEIDMNQEQEEEELHRRLNGSNPEIIEYED